MKKKMIRILNVEDERVDHRALMRMIKEKGLPYDVDQATTIIEAIELLKKKRYDIVLIDYQMPDGTGIDLLEKVNDAPSIFITGSGDERVAVEAMKRGAYDYIIKDPMGGYLECLPTSIDKVLKTFHMEEECKRADEKIRMLSRAVEQSPSTVMITDVKGNIEYVNPKFIQLTGYTYKEIIGQNPRILKSGKTKPEEYERLWKTITSGNEWKGEFQNRKKNGELYLEDTYIAPISNAEGDIINFIAIKEDITERKKKDKQLFVQSRQIQMGEMLSMIAHQWKQPLTIISAISNNIMNRLILDNIDKSEVIESLEKGQNHIKYLSQTIDDFRDFFKPDRAKESVNIEDIIRKCLGLIRHSMKRNRIKIDVSFKSVKEIESYNNELIQVFLNILQNAEDIINHRKVENALVVIRTYENDGFVVVDIRDNAGGISEDIIDDIFLPYFSTKEEKQGTGLGLYICKTIVEEHCKGEIIAENVKGGVNFKVKLPIH